MQDLKKIKKAYFIGIKGSGVVAIVEILHALGIEVTGSDTPEKFFTDQILKKMGIRYFDNFKPENIPEQTDLVIYSTAYNRENNVEIAEAIQRKLPMISYPEMLAELFNRRYGIAVCGTHGKTTTSAMLADVMKSCGADPGAVIGSQVKEWGGNALTGSSEFFVIEADEYQNKLQLYEPKAAILTSVDWDHPDFFPTLNDYKQAFTDFVRKIPKSGFLLVWGDSVNTREAAGHCQAKIIRYGFSEDNEMVIKKIAAGKFVVSYGGSELGEFTTLLAGDHNILNAAAVVGVCLEIKLDLEQVRQALAGFQGTTRRFEQIGRRNGALLIDDYGHHPEEIRATLKGARERYPEKNIITVFHPHTFTRTKALLHEFAQSFDGADQVIVLDIYGSAREVQGGVSSKELVELINKYDSGKAQHLPTIDAAVEHLKDKIGKNDVVLCIGAGNVFEVAEKLKQ